MNNPATPLELRKLKADMVLMGLSLTDITVATRIPYLTISRVLNGHDKRPEHLEKIRRAIEMARELQPA